jgi:hypothetical protein
LGYKDHGIRPFCLKNQCSSLPGSVSGDSTQRETRLQSKACFVAVVPCNVNSWGVSNPSITGHKEQPPLTEGPEPHLPPVTTVPPPSPNHLIFHKQPINIHQSTQPRFRRSAIAIPSMAPPRSASSSSSREGYSHANASHRYLRLKHAGPSRDEHRHHHQKRPKYHVTRPRRRPTIMAHTDNSDLDPSWQDLDRYVPTCPVPFIPSLQTTRPDQIYLHPSAPNLGELESIELM